MNFLNDPMFYIAVAVTVGIIITAAAALCVKLKVRTHEVKSPKAKGKIRIVHVSDLHESLFGKGQHKLSNAVKAAAPDLILVTGDMVEDDDFYPNGRKELTAENPARIALEALAGIAPTYMVFGNHESNIQSTDTLCRDIEATGVRLMHRVSPISREMCETVNISGTEIRICGMDDPYFDRIVRKKRRRSMSDRVSEDRTPCTYDKSIWRERVETEYAAVKDDGALTLLLSHRPEEFELYSRLGFDIAFSGHAHGGQWRIPYIMNGLYAPHQGFFPKHAGGIYSCGQMCHVVSRGLSKKRFIRIFNRPEIWVVDILPEIDIKA